MNLSNSFSLAANYVFQLSKYATSSSNEELLNTFIDPFEVRKKSILFICY
ncbi:MAG: hypothetical protein A4E44_01713 [Methanosaeta sp. PtaB.Bin018]|nr:MAG: hypothetical protein A4E44_01713 [Methanosaeta sp. PtaB.Bin018]OPY46159.1 MAG: hypothetical protein A4E46_00991 [Methanosaeta sp. PtaU1.Bin016]